MADFCVHKPVVLWVSVGMEPFQLQGMTLAQAQSSDITLPLPSEFLSFVSEPLGIQPSAMTGYASRDQTMTDNSLEHCRAFGLPNSILVDLPVMTNIAAGVAASTDHALTSAGGIIGALRTAKIVLPTVASKVAPIG